MLEKIFKKTYLSTLKLNNFHLITYYKPSFAGQIVLCKWSLDEIIERSDKDNALVFC